MAALGWIAALLIGLSMGLIGGGGSILTVPILVYLFGIDAYDATAYSLFVVGITGAFGAYRKALKGEIAWSAALYFGAPSMLTVFITRKYILPALPNQFQLGQLPLLSKSQALLLAFAILMLLASFSMMTGRKETIGDGCCTTKQKLFVVLQGALVGAVTAMVGAGGGFLIIPALVLWSKLSMKSAIGTSLFLIAVNALLGFSAALGHHHINWFLLGGISLLAIIGLIIGNAFQKKVSGDQLRKAFAWFVLAMALFILYQEGGNWLKGVV